MTTYDDRQAAKRARLEAGAASAGARAATAHTRARSIGAAIPFGQPILVGHHSEGRHRRDADRIHSLTGKAVAESERAAELQRRADAIGTGGVSQDDPEAVEKLESERVKLQKLRADIKAINAAVRKRGTGAQIAALLALGYDESQASAIVTPDAFGNVGVPAFRLTNLGANIRRIEKRIAELRAKAAASVRAPIVTDRYEITEDREANRCRIEFRERQPAPVIAALRSAGFRWTPSAGVWQRHTSAHAWHAAQQIAALVDREVLA